MTTLNWCKLFCMYCKNDLIIEFWCNLKCVVWYWNCVQACVRACVSVRACHWKWRHMLIILESSLRKTHSYFFQELGILRSVALTTIDWLAWEATSLIVELSFQDRSEASRLASPAQAVKSVSLLQSSNPLAVHRHKGVDGLPSLYWEGSGERKTNTDGYHTQLSRFHHGSP